MTRVTKFTRILLASAVATGALSIGVSAFFGFENAKGRRTMDQVRSYWSKNGLAWAPEAYLPESLSDQENFGASPFFAPLFAYSLTQRSGLQNAAHFDQTAICWRDKAAVERLLAINLNRFSSNPCPGLCTFTMGKPVELSAWQTFLCARGNSQVTPANPAEDVLRALATFDKDLMQLATRAHTCRLCVYPIHYQEGAQAVCAHLQVLDGIVQITTLRSVAELQTGRSRDALDHCMLGLFLCNSVSKEPFLRSQSWRVHMLRSALQPVWEGLAARTWTASQLQQLQGSIEEIDILGHYPTALLGTLRLSFRDSMDRIRSGELAPEDLGQFDGAPQATHPWVPRVLLRTFPTGWHDQQEAEIHRFAAEFCLPIIDAQQRRVRPPDESARSALTVLHVWPGYKWLSASLLPSLLTAIPKDVAYGQTLANLAAIACAAERYFLHFRRYPASLSELAPGFIDAVPNDIMTGAPLLYSRDGGSGFRAYSVGWAPSHEGGYRGAQGGGSNGQPDGADWVWWYSRQ